MVLFALIARVSDGLPLSATTDHETSQQVLESKKCAKILSKKCEFFPDRCSLYTGSHWLYVISSLGVSFITLCEESYPTVLAFCFLDELQREFISSYDARKVKNVSRPYALIEFNIILQKIKQRYNNTRSLKPRTNLTDMSQEVKLRPPHRLSMSDVSTDESYPMNESVFAENYKPLHVKRHPTSSRSSTIIIFLCCLWAFYHFIRFGAIVSSGPVLLQHEQSDEIIVAVSAFFGACVTSVLQARFLSTMPRWRLLKAILSGMLITLCCLILSIDGWLDDIFTYGHIASAWLAVLAVLCQRTSEEKLPNYTV